MLDLHKRLIAAQDVGDKQRLQRLIESTDQKIDALVYELYGLTPEEIAIVEGEAVKGPNPRPLPLREGVTVGLKAQGNEYD